MFRAVVVVDKASGAHLAEFVLAPCVISEFSVEFGDGLQRLFVDFVDGKVIDSLTVEIDKTPRPQGDYILQPSKDAGFWVATDKKNNCVIKFREGAYNETAKITFLEDMPEADALELASVIRGLGDFLAANHPDLV